MRNLNQTIGQFGFILAGLLVAGTANAAKSTSSTVIMDTAGIRVQIGPSFKTHLQILVDGIPFTDFSTLYALRPNAGGRFYGYEDDREIGADADVQELPGGGSRVVFPMRAPRGEFIGKQTMEITPDRTLRMAIDGRLTSGTAGKFDHRIGGVFTGWLSGRSFSAAFADGTTTTGVIPTKPTTENPDLSTVVSGFKELRIAGPTGPIIIETTSTMPVSLVDFRKNRFFDGQPLFFLGITERPLEKNAHVQYEVSIRFPESKPSTPSIPRQSVTSPVLKVSDAYTPAVPEDIIVPTPRKVTWGEGTVTVPKDSIALKQKRSSNNLLEHYHLRIADKVEISAETTEGLRAGRITLQQLVRGEDDKTITYRRCEIDDWAAMPFRGIHFFSGAGGHNTQIKMIEKVLAPLKLNALVYHCDNIQWDTHPEIKKSGEGMPKKQARSVANAAEAAGITVVPLINSFGHMNWLLENEHYRHLADNPANPFAYNPTKPEVYKIVDDIFGEAIELFKPRYFHIGHDEIDLKGFPLDPELQKIGSRKLIRDDIQRWRDWFHERGVRILIWADMFIGPGESADFTLAPTVEEAKLRRDGLPKDVIMCDWHYIADPPENFKSIKILNEAGFDTVASTWFHPRNITNFAKACADARETTDSNGRKRGESLGLMQTTWAGGNLNEKAIERNSDQMAAYVVAAEASWTGGIREPEQFAYNYRQFFSQIWAADMLPKEKRPGWKCDIASNNNSADMQQGKFPMLPFISMSSRFGNIPPNIEIDDPEYRTSVVFPIGEQATHLLFDVGATCGGPSDPAIATTTISYDDGTTSESNGVLVRTFWPATTIARLPTHCW